MCGTECLKFISTPDVIIEDAPWGKHEWFVKPPLTQSKHLMLVKVIMGPGQAHRFHYHPNFEEAIYFLQGKAMQWVGKKSTAMKAGDVAHVPAGEVHGTYNTSKEPCVLLVSMASAQFRDPMVVDVYKDSPWSDLMNPNCSDYSTQ